MTIFTLVMLCLLFCLAPAGVLWVCRKVSFLGKIGPVLLLYILGVIIGNIGIKPEGMASLQDLMSSAMVPLAIPMMLFGCTFRLRETRQQLKALLTGLSAVVIAVVAGYLIFGRNIEEGAKIGGMLIGVYTGGTINLAALNRFEDGAVVDAAALIEAGIIHACPYGLKVLSNGTLTKKITVKAAAFSESAKEKIEQAGGKAEVV